MTAALAWATAWYNKRKRQQRVAPSTEFMRQIETGDAPTFGGARSGPGMGASVSAAEGAGHATRKPSPAAGALTEAMGVAVSGACVATAVAGMGWLTYVFHAPHVR